MLSILEYSVQFHPVFRPGRLPIHLRLYDYVADDEDLYGYQKSHQKKLLIRFGVRRILKRCAFPWMMHLPFPHRPEFFYRRGAQDIRVHFNARNAQFESVYAGKFAPCYEPRVASLLAMLTPRGGVFFDVGANWGHFSLYLASVLGDQVRIHAFEPFPNSFQDLRNVVGQVGLASQVTCHQLALGSEDKLVSMTLRRGLETGFAEIDHSAGPGQDSVPCARLDRLALPDPDVMKIDVEGHERHVLLGAEATLQRARPHLIFESKMTSADDDREARSTLEFLHTRGYRIFEPVWSLPSPEGHFLTRDDRAAMKAAKPRLALREMIPAERSLLPVFVNLFACHEDRIAEVTNRAE